MRVLVVDDNDLICKNIQRTLNSMGINVDVTRNGKEGLYATSIASYNFIISDVNMPIMDGLEFYNRSRKRDKTKFLFMTGGDDNGIIGTCISKPFTKKQLLEKLEMLSLTVYGKSLEEIIN